MKPGLGTSHTDRPASKALPVKRSDFKIQQHERARFLVAGAAGRIRPLTSHHSTSAKAKNANQRASSQQDALEVETWNNFGDVEIPDAHQYIACTCVRSLSAPVIHTHTVLRRSVTNQAVQVVMSQTGNRVRREREAEMVGNRNLSQNKTPSKKDSGGELPMVRE